MHARALMYLHIHCYVTGAFRLVDLFNSTHAHPDLYELTNESASQLAQLVLTVHAILVGSGTTNEPCSMRVIFFEHMLVNNILELLYKGHIHRDQPLSRGCPFLRGLKTYYYERGYPLLGGSFNLRFNFECTLFYYIRM